MSNDNPATSAPAAFGTPIGAAPTYDVLIIGCGPAGLSAAIYTSRAQLKTIIFGDHKKGNLFKAHQIGNYFGFPEGISGATLNELGYKHALGFGTEHVNAEIVDIQPQADGTFTVKDDAQNSYQAKAVILATGQSYALTGIKNEQELTGKGISYCANCDGFFFRNKKICVIGSGNYACEEALQLINYTKDITIISHGKDFSFSPAIEEELKKSGIKLEKTQRIKEIAADAAGKKAEKLITLDGAEMPFEGFFMAVGSAGAAAFAKKLGLETAGSYIKIDSSGATNIKGIFAAGDCTGSAPQVAVSVGGGCIAALGAIKFIRGLNIYIQYN